MEVPVRRLNVELIVPGGEVAVQQAVAGDDALEGGLLVVAPDDVAHLVVNRPPVGHLQHGIGRKNALRVAVQSQAKRRLWAVNSTRMCSTRPSSSAAADLESSMGQLWRKKAVVLAVLRLTAAAAEVSRCGGEEKKVVVAAAESSSASFVVPLSLLLLQLFSLLRRLRPLQLPVLGQQLLAVVVQRLKIGSAAATLKEELVVPANRKQAEEKKKGDN
ncbi:hypothetical protein TYRP_009320 [Tyrophagus putrescentiae]|nr:hypothetical protein TYRP_009320 [Tyrophagus putrescentiae]